jgi:hypothetical protein
MRGNVKDNIHCPVIFNVHEQQPLGHVYLLNPLFRIHRRPNNVLLPSVSEPAPTLCQQQGVTSRWSDLFGCIFFAR